MKADDRIKVRQYVFERDALTDFLAKYADNYSLHIKHAIKFRLGVVNRELKNLGLKSTDSTEPARAEGGSF